MSNRERDVEARRKAQALWDQHKTQGEKMLKEREKVRLAEAEKLTRLRELRLAKESAEARSAVQKIMTPLKTSA